MKITNNIGTFLLCIYLILLGITGIFAINLGGLSILLPALALSAGVLLLIGK